MQRILALDPAAHCGYAHTSGERGVWHLKDGDARLVDLFRQIITCAEFNEGIDLIAFEDASFGSINPNTQAMHNELRGIIKFAAAQLGAKTVVYHPTTIKAFATGSGRADKEQMIRACKTRLGIETRDDNVADACFILEMAKQGYRPPISAKKRKQNLRRAVRKQRGLF
jgi:Holliday junction resolvasome RuvABC endonuclease subunit